jgi:hypothetical protein
MAFALLFALALSGAEPFSPAPADQPIAASAPSAPPAVDPKPMTETQMEDAVPDGAPKDDYGLVAWCHGALSGQIELDPIVEKDMDAIEGKVKAAQRKASDAAIAKEHKRYMALYEKALLAAEKASPVAIHQKGVDAELQGYKIWGPTRNKPPIWRMVDWGNWEVPPACEKAAKRLYDHASLFGEALKSEGPPATPEAAPPAAPADQPVATPASDGLRGPN